MKLHAGTRRRQRWDAVSQRGLPVPRCSRVATAACYFLLGFGCPSGAVAGLCGCGAGSGKMSSQPIAKDRWLVDFGFQLIPPDSILSRGRPSAEAKCLKSQCRMVVTVDQTRRKGAPDESIPRKLVGPLEIANGRSLGEDRGRTKSPELLLQSKAMPSGHGSPLVDEVSISGRNERPPAWHAVRRYPGPTYASARVPLDPAWSPGPSPCKRISGCAGRGMFQW